MRKAIIGVAAGVVLGLSATVAVAAIPDSEGVIHACRSTRDGNLRVIDTDAGQKCTKSEQAIKWNQAGPAGPAGPSGLSKTYFRLYGGYDDPIEFAAVPGTGRSQPKDLVSVDTPEIDEGLYLMTARVQDIRGSIDNMVTCGAFGGLEEPKAGTLADSAQAPPGGVIKLQAVMSMRAGDGPIVLQCTASGLADDESLHIGAYVFALIRIG